MNFTASSDNARIDRLIFFIFSAFFLAFVLIVFLWALPRSIFAVPCSLESTLACENIPPTFGSNYCCGAPNYVCNDEYWYQCVDEGQPCQQFVGQSGRAHDPCAKDCGAPGCIQPQPGCPAGTTQCGSGCYDPNIACPAGYSFVCNNGTPSCVPISQPPPPGGGGICNPSGIILCNGGIVDPAASGVTYCDANLEYWTCSGGNWVYGGNCSCGGGPPPPPGPPPPGPVPPPPPPAGAPSNLSVSSSCVSNSPQVTFTWTDNNSSEIGYSIAVNTQAWTGQAAPLPFGYANLGANATGFTWSGSSPLTSSDGGAAWVPAQNATYYWYVQANGSANTAVTYGGNSSGPPGASFTVSSCAPPSTPTAFGVFFDKNSNGILNPEGEFFNQSGNPAFSPSIASLTVDGSAATVGAGGISGVYSWQNGSSHSAQIVPASGWRATSWSTACAGQQPAASYTTPNYTAQFSVPAAGICASFEVYLGITQTAPSILTVVPTLSPPGATCANGPYDVAFSWTGNANNWTIDVDDQAGIDADGWATWKSSKIGINGTSTTGPAGFNNGLAFQPGVNYYWRMYYGVAGNWVYPPSSSTPPGSSFTVPQCPDLNLATDASSELQFYTDGTYSTVKSPATYLPSETTMYIRVRTVNSSTVAITQAFRVGFYLTGPNPYPGCGGTLTTSKNLAGLGAGAVDTWQLTATTPVAGSYTAYAFADDNPCPNGAIVESDPANNTRSRAYSVSAPNAWFETLGGDVGSHGNIAAQQVPPGTRYNSSYLLAGSTLTNVIQNNSGFKLVNYTGKLAPAGGTYNYLAERFKQRAQDEGAPDCDIDDSSTLPAGEVYAYCPNSITVDSTVTLSGHQVWFIDGDLNINQNIVVSSGPVNTATFIVSGSVNVANNVVQLDGIYVAGANFISGSGTASALVVHGAVYANSANLGRVLASGNDINPAERIEFDPKYLVGLSQILGTASISWREVAP